MSTYYYITTAVRKIIFTIECAHACVNRILYIQFYKNVSIIMAAIPTHMCKRAQKCYCFRFRLNIRFAVDFDIIIDDIDI